MENWVRRITSLMGSSSDNKEQDQSLALGADLNTKPTASLLTQLSKQNSSNKLGSAYSNPKNSKNSFFSTINSLGMVDQSFANFHTRADISNKNQHNKQEQYLGKTAYNQVNYPSDKQAIAVTKISAAEEKPKVTDDPFSPDEGNSNLEALNRLRALPRGSQVESRIAAIQDLLREKEIFKTLISLRWPKGVVCPRCNSSNVVRRDPPPDAVDLRHYYVCLNCKGEGDPSGFDDFTGLPIKSIHALRQWILCWYLIGFCSLAQVAKVLGLSVYEVSQIASLGSTLADLPSELREKFGATKSAKDQKQSQQKAKQDLTDTQEEYTRSSWRGEKKPGPKSK